MVDGDAGRVLRFAACHELVLATQIRAFLGIEQAAEQQAVDALIGRGCLARVGFGRGLAGLACTPRGRQALELAPLPAPVVDRGLRGAVGAVWVWIRAQDGRFDGVQVLSAREALAHDLAAESTPGSPPGGSSHYGLRIGGVPSPSQTGLHYPDVLLRFHDGWCAVHLQLAPVRADELVARLRSYGADERYGGVVFLVERERVARQVEQAALSAGVSAVTLVRGMEWS